MEGGSAALDEEGGLQHVHSGSGKLDAGATQLGDEHLDAAGVLVVQVGEAAAGLKEGLGLVLYVDVEDVGEEQQRVSVFLVAEHLQLGQHRPGLAAAGHEGDEGRWQRSWYTGVVLYEAWAQGCGK